MKKILTIILSLGTIMIFGQESCAFDRVQQELERKDPEARKSREETEARLLKMNAREYLNKIGATSKNGLYTGQIYEIPVVVHIIESSDPSNSFLARTDAQIQEWIDNCNKIFATTYGNGYYPEGLGNDGGNLIPFKLVLAKRTPQCSITNGIIRYNGSSLPGYDASGMRQSGANGPNQNEVKSIAPHWPENSYFNMYLFIGFDGNKWADGLWGWAGFPSNSNSAYNTFMKVSAVTMSNQSVLAHEVGHALGLDHVFSGTTTTPSSPQASDCPDNSNCTTNNDKICDTEPTANLLYVSPFPSNTNINPCTGSPYQGIQYNVMNYTARPRKFTTGQRERGVAMFMQRRSNLTRSLGATALDPASPTPILIASACKPTGINNPSNQSMGPTRVQLGNIDNVSDAFWTYSNGYYYADYSLQNCFTKDVFTDISVNSNQLKISFGGSPQYIKAWIDYNNNGIFEDSELIGASPSRLNAGQSPYVINFTPPVTATRDTYLRMRVIADRNQKTPCEDLTNGQTEDYSVRILGATLHTIDTKKATNAVHYSPDNNSLILVSSGSKKFGSYEIYDMSGKMIQKGKSETSEIILNFYHKGTYVLTFVESSRKVSKKFIQ